MIRNILLTLLLNLFIVTNLFTQEMPLVYDVENTGANYPKPYLPSLSELPTIQALPDPFEWSDDRGRIANLSDWRYRRVEIKTEIEHYEIGEKPVRPDTIEASYSNGTLTVIVTVNGKTLTLTSSIILPEGAGPFPAVIGMNSPNGSVPADIFTSRNIARITFSHNQVTTYGSQQNSNPYYQLYPHLNSTNTGQYSAWAWGVSRLIDGLELVQNDLPIDLEHIAVTGCSYAGKMALFSGAFDERIALTIAQESGGGGAPAWRVSETLGNVERLGSTDHNWFKEDMFQFANNNVSKLPHDHHELMAMVAPRALIVTGNTDYEWLANPSCYVSAKATQTVYEALGIVDRFGFYIDGGHGHCAIPTTQSPSIESFVDKFLLGIDSVNSNVATTPYNTNLSPWITWTSPELSNDTLYFAKLLQPSDQQIGMDTIITFKWNKIQKAEKFYFQLATDLAFKNIVARDSTTDTTITIIGLTIKQKYYWQIQVKSAAGLGPWSNVRSFVTTLTLPGIPHLTSATSNKTGYVNFKWSKVKDADQYLIQVSGVETFVDIFKEELTSDTISSISWFTEGKTYYWHIKAINAAGSSPWGESESFVMINPPRDLFLEKNSQNEITLTWDDRSSIEDGFIIERKQNPESSFTIIDTVSENSDRYIDNTIEQSQTYTYRVKVYKDSTASAFSNEASLNLVGIEEEGEEIPTEYSLSQNYPNPFNPNTKIKFALPQTAVTKIIIYDLLGSEIQTLINKELKAGNHEINFDATDFQSGVYFYRIQSGNFVSTKKMILMK